MGGEADSRRDAARPAAPPEAASGALVAGPHGDKLASIAATLNAAAPVQRVANRTGMPDRLKAGVEALSGMSLDHVRVHHNSARPAQLNAHAFAQGADIHLAPGQGKHLPHEAWHVVQQAQGRVKPTMQMKVGQGAVAQRAAGVPINDDQGLEQEADAMGARALATGPSLTAPIQRRPAASGDGVVQRALWKALDDLSWSKVSGAEQVPPAIAATAAGQYYDDSIGKIFPDHAAYVAHHADPFGADAESDSSQSDSDYTEEDDEEDDDAGEKVASSDEAEEAEAKDDDDDGEKEASSDEAEDDDDNLLELTLEERQAIERKAQRRPFETSLLTPSTRYPTRELTSTAKFRKNKVLGERTTQSGPVTITLEEVELYELDKPIKRERPVRVSGLVEETVTTGRPAAPDPIAGKQIYFGTGKAPKASIVAPRNDGLTDAERGHIMALELGGPDIAENIVPQWAKFQGADTWRKMETAVLKKAKALPKGQRLNFIAQVFYKSSGELTPTLNTFAVPTGFKVVTQVIGDKKRVISEEVEFELGQAHDDTDEKLRDRKLKQIDGADDDSALSLTTPKLPRKRKKSSAKSPDDNSASDEAPPRKRKKKQKKDEEEESVPVKPAKRKPARADAKKKKRTSARARKAQEDDTPVPRNRRKAGGKIPVSKNVSSKGISKARGGRRKKDDG